MNKHEYYMRIAIDLAKKGIGITKTNPVVGAVVVKNNRIIGKGYHQKYGDAHAEINALNFASEDVDGSDLYVTLEPCSTYGKTPPCTDAIIKSRIKHVYIGVKDVDKGNANKGIKKLKEHGIEVTIGILEDEIYELNKCFIYNQQNSLPYINLKLALSLDGKIAINSGDSKWITSQESRDVVHNLRQEYDAILVGKNTVLKDNPRLNVRLNKVKRNPIKIIIDRNLNIPLSSNVFMDCKLFDVFVIANHAQITCELTTEYRKNNIIIIPFKNTIKEALHILYCDHKISSILCEGGGMLAAILLKHELVSEFNFFYAPKIIGGDGINSIGSLGIESISNSIKGHSVSFNKIGCDFLVTGRVGS